MAKEVNRSDVYHILSKWSLLCMCHSWGDTLKMPSPSRGHRMRTNILDALWQCEVCWEYSTSSKYGSNVSDSASLGKEEWEDSSCIFLREKGSRHRLLLQVPFFSFYNAQYRGIVLSNTGTVTSSLSPVLSLLKVPMVSHSLSYFPLSFRSLLHNTNRNTWSIF